MYNMYHGINDNGVAFLQHFLPCQIKSIVGVYKMLLH